MLLGVRNEKHVFVFDIEAVRDSAVDAVKAVTAAAAGGAAGNVSEEVRPMLLHHLFTCVCVCVCVSNYLHTQCSTVYI